DRHQRVLKDSLSAKPQLATSDVFKSETSSRSQRLLEDILVSWDGYQLTCKLGLLIDSIAFGTGCEEALRGVRVEVDRKDYMRR
ncbi:hypothetical protein Tco_1473305, partial [Tanacetum coccineum]